MDGTKYLGNVYYVFDVSYKNYFGLKRINNVQTLDIRDH